MKTQEKYLVGFQIFFYFCAVVFILFLSMPVPQAEASGTVPDDAWCYVYFNSEGDKIADCYSEVGNASAPTEGTCNAAVANARAGRGSSTDEAFGYKCFQKSTIKKDPKGKDVTYTMAGPPKGVDPDQPFCYGVHDKIAKKPKWTCFKDHDACVSGHTNKHHGMKKDVPCQPQAGLPSDARFNEICYVTTNSIGHAKPKCAKGFGDCQIAHDADQNHIGPCLTKENAQNRAYRHNALLAKKNAMKYTHQDVVVNDDPDALVPCKNGCNFDQLMILIKRVVNFLIMIVAAPFATIFMVYAGFLYMTSMGNPSKIKQAKDIFFWIVIGFVIALSAWLVVNALLLGLGVTGAFNLLG